MENQKNNITIFEVLGIIALLEGIILTLLLIINRKVFDALMLCVFIIITLFIIYFGVKGIHKKNPSLFIQTPISLYAYSFCFIALMVIYVMIFNTSYDKLSYRIGDIQVKFPKDRVDVYGLKDTNNKYYYANYYIEKCLIEIKKIDNNKNYTIFENIKNNIEPEKKITGLIKLKDIYELEFTEGNEIINGKEWTTKQVNKEPIKYTLYYTVINDYIYQIDTFNYSSDPSLCTNKIDETIKTIKYSN